MTERESAGLRITAEGPAVIHYAMQQGGTRLLRSVVVENAGETPAERVILTIRAEPEFCLPVVRCLEYLPPRSSVELRDVSPEINGAFLAGLTEKCAGYLELTLEKEGTELARLRRELTSLAFDEWQGSGICPELLCAFLTPNHPAVTRLNARAAVLLERWTGDPSLNAYQTRNPNRVLQQAAAIYGAIQEQNLIYAVAPAHFERAGQRIRLCDTVLEQKMGNCLDLTLLYAACLEAAGLRPLLILKSDHAFAGVWLEELSFPETVQDDVTQLTKRLAEGVSQAAVVECTLCTAGKNTDFDAARRVAAGELTSEPPVELILDVHRARVSGVTPLPQRVLSDGGWRVIRPERPEGSLTREPAAIRGPVSIPTAEREAFSRRQLWERKLLDLGLRNTLIHLRPTRTLIPILVPSADELENALSSGKDFAILPRPTDWKAPANFSDFENLREQTDIGLLLKSEFSNLRLRSALTEAELRDTVKALYRSARMALEENGANTLYLALGLLRWYETAKSDRPLYAPVLLLPVELVRRSASQGYVLRLRDDEPQCNITILEKLKQDFDITVNGLDPLPQDDHGVDTRAVFTILRKAVMAQARWDVLETACLGLFSFSQFVMWNDLRSRSEDLRRNKLVRSLMDGKLAWQAASMSLRERVPEDGALLPLPADASQLYAIEAATRGESFVLHGPPGTGKSQTITALIANALAQGRTVLFAAEKMAALSVVQKRLEKLGLGPFCLELHSNKARKKAVLEQLRCASEVTRETTPEEYLTRAEELASLRRELDAYADALHRRLPCGGTVYTLINQFEENRDAPELTPFPEAVLEGVDGARLHAWETAAERLAVAAGAVGAMERHPLRRVRRREYAQRLRLQVSAGADAYAKALECACRAASALAEALSLPVPDTREALLRLIALSEALPQWCALPPAWGRAADPAAYLAGVDALCAHALQAQALQNQLCQVWEPAFLREDAGALTAELREINAKWFLGKAIGRSSLAKRLAPLQKTPVAKEALGEQFALLKTYQAEAAETQAALAVYGSDMGAWLSPGPDWGRIRAAAAAARESAQRLRAIPGGDALRAAAAGNAAALPYAAPAREAVAAMETARETLYQMLELAPEDGPGWAARETALCRSLPAHVGELRDWIAWQSAAADAEAQGLTPLTRALRAGMEPQSALPALRRAVSQGLAIRAIDDCPALSRFSGAVFNETLRQFRKADGELMELSKQEIRCRLAARVPDFTREAAQSSELGILQRAIRSGGRGVSIRRLFEQLPLLLPRLCPCMLMSPMSAAQYLDPKREPFDLVVFDEASQLPTCKAVGVLARGENAVVVGDPNQMPPTSFFAVNNTDEEHLDEEDLESILDDCLALHMPETHLLWHYRSRHESLIAFSNSRFYENRLFTFPSVEERESRVRLVPVDGVFQRGKLRQNRAEAEAVVAELKRRCHEPSLRGFSVGVVTFNVNQQNLIDDLLNEACREDPELDAWVSQSEEPVFIKNLENVQGDERDVILFSVGHGPDETGKVSMNFGPLNQEGGWRRLNVAVSRARWEMVVYSTLTPDQIDPGRTSAEGVLALKAFLEYASGRALPESAAAAAERRSAAEGVAETICAALRQRGYETDRQVGHSEYRVDIGICDPDEPERYLLGVMLDGPTYGSAKTARDRELAQTAVLEGLGWRLLRVWTLDWWEDRQQELGRILGELERLRAMPREERAPRPMAGAAVKPEPVPESEPTGTVEQDRPAPEPPTSLRAVLYRATELSVTPMTPEEFTLETNANVIRRKLRAVVKQEAPICQSLLAKRVLQSCGISRMGSRLQASLESGLALLGFPVTREEEQTVLWRKEQEPESCSILRSSPPEAKLRDVREIPVAEAANALSCALYTQLSLSREDLIRESARLMGYTRVTAAVAPLFEAAIRYAVLRGRLEQGPAGNLTLSREEQPRAQAMAEALTECPEA